MTVILLIMQNFLRLVFRKWWAWLVYLVLPGASFFLIVLLMRLGGLPNAVNQGMNFHLFFIFIQAGFITGLLVKDREEGVLARVRTAPVRSVEYTLGNIAAAFSVIIIQILCTLAIAALFYPSVVLPVLPSLFLIYAASGFSAVSLGVFLSIFAQDSTQGAFIYNFVLYPSSILGGCFFPFEFMSPAMQRISVIFPQTWGVKAIAAVMAGDSLLGILRIGIILLTGGLFLVLYAYVYQRRDVHI